MAYLTLYQFYDHSDPILVILGVEYCRADPPPHSTAILLGKIVWYGVWPARIYTIYIVLFEWYELSQESTFVSYQSRSSTNARVVYNIGKGIRSNDEFTAGKESLKVFYL